MDIRAIISNPRVWLAIGLIAIGAAARVAPSPPNVAPIAAIALLGGATLPMPWAFIVPGAAMFASDMFIGFDSWMMRVTVYASFCAMVILGRYLPDRFRVMPLISASLAGSFLFYLVTNAVVWKFSGMYQPTLDGLLLSYYYALPFFRNTVGGDLFYVFAFFGVYHAVPYLLRNTRFRFARKSALHRRGMEILR